MSYIKVQGGERVEYSDETHQPVVPFFVLPDSNDHHPYKVINGQRIAVDNDGHIIYDDDDDDF